MPGGPFCLSRILRVLAAKTGKNQWTLWQSRGRIKGKKVRTVEKETTIAQGVRAADASAGYDAACKRVLSEKAILARIMKSCLEE